jgi:hypothetical protein
MLAADRVQACTHLQQLLHHWDVPSCNEQLQDSCLLLGDEGAENRPCLEQLCGHYHTTRSHSRHQRSCHALSNATMPTAAGSVD